MKISMPTCAEQLLQIGRSWSAGRHGLVALLLLLVQQTLFGQSDSTLLRRDQELHAIDGGYLGSSFVGGNTYIARYTSRLADTLTGKYIRLRPDDLHVPIGSAPRDRALLLATSYGRAVLYSISTNGSPELTPLWQSSLPPLRRVIATADFDGDGSFESAIVGDSAFVVVGLDGAERFQLVGEIIDAFVGSVGGAFIVVSRVRSETVVQWIAPRGGTVAATAHIAGARPSVVALGEGATGEELVVVVPGTPARVHRFDAVRGAAIGSPIELRALPRAVVPLRTDDGAAMAMLFDTYPKPSIELLGSELEIDAIEYPLDGIPRATTWSRNRIVILSADSLAIYDRRMQLLGTARSAIGTTGIEIEELDSSRLLISSPGGSEIVWHRTEVRGWIERHMAEIVAGAGLGLLLLLGITLWRRYRAIRTVYNNLVRVPNSNGVILLNRAQRVAQINSSAREMLDIATYIPLGRHISEYLVSDESRPLLSTLRLLFSNGVPFEERLDVRRGDEIRALSFRGRPMLGEYGYNVGYLLLIEDVTQTIERERLVNWASVAHHIAHEMKTPLGTVQITAEMLRDRLGGMPNDGEYVRAATRILKQSSRLREIVEDLLTVARTESLQFVTTDLRLLLTSLAHDYIEYLPATTEMRLDIQGENFRMMADVQQLTVAIRNLLDNARHAIGPAAGGVLTLALLDEGDRIVVRVEDNGQGMSEKTLANLFKPFYTEREGGSGIGTVIVKRVVEGHGGTVRVESTLGKGTTFMLTLPRG